MVVKIKEITKIKKSNSRKIESRHLRSSKQGIYQYPYISGNYTNGYTNEWNNENIILIPKEGGIIDSKGKLNCSRQVEKIYAVRQLICSEWHLPTNLFILLLRQISARNWIYGTTILSLNLYFLLESEMKISSDEHTNQSFEDLFSNFQIISKKLDDSLENVRQIKKIILNLLIK